MSVASLLAFNRVRKCHRDGGQRPVVFDSVDLEVRAGDSIGVWGGPQAGKSALLRLAAGIELADAGAVCFQGRNFAQLASWERASLLRSSIGFAPALDERVPAGLDRSGDVVGFVGAPLTSAGWTELEASERALALLTRVGAIDCADQEPWTLSPGQRTRVVLARALIRRPALLLVDEPALTTSRAERTAIHAVLVSLAAERSLTLIVVSADPEMLTGFSRSYSAGQRRLLASARPGSVVPFPSRSKTDGFPVP